MPFLLLIVLLMMGCSTAEKQGFRQTHSLTCKHWTNQCYGMARKRCVDGYDVISKSETEKMGGPHGKYREYTMTVGCH